MGFNLKSMVERLNPVCRKALDAAAALCQSRGNPFIELEHYFYALMGQEDTDLKKVLSFYQVSLERVSGELERSLERIRKSGPRTPTVSGDMVRLLEQAWLFSSLYMDSGFVRSGSVLLAMLDNEVLRSRIIDAAPVLTKVPRDSLKKEILDIIATTGEEIETAKVMREKCKSYISKTPEDKPQNVSGELPSSLSRYTVNMTDLARRGLIDPVYGRDSEIRHLVDILLRRKQNNPILTGDAGVGKTAVVEGLALKIASGRVPGHLKSVELCRLDLGLLQAGAGIRGEFEERLNSVLAEVRGAARRIILFIDEAHTMVGAGGESGSGDAANLLKPALARGELATVAATTHAEYKKYFEKDPALVRRFQEVHIGEPDEETAAGMLRGIALKLEAHHRVRILEEAVRDAVSLSARYITGRKLPDKAVTVLDTACARVSVAREGVPPAIESLGAEIESIKLEISTLEKEKKQSRLSTMGRLSRLVSRKESELLFLHEQWEKEKMLVARILDAESKNEESGDVDSLREELIRIQKRVRMVPLYVDSRGVADVVSSFTGIPAGKMVRDETRLVMDLEEKLGTRILGQVNAVETIGRRLKTYRADLDDPDKPIGVFLLAGPGGVGKTETAAVLSELLYDGPGNMISVNMSEYQEAYSVSGLKGAPPGYVGHGKGGVLTEAVRQKPYSLVLMDEIDKAHPDVLDLVSQVFEKGVMDDSEGLSVSFKNSLIILTTRMGEEGIRLAREKGNDYLSLKAAVEKELARVFKASFLSRLTVIPYLPLDKEHLRGIAGSKLMVLRDRVRKKHGLALVWTPSVVELMTGGETGFSAGARIVDMTLENDLIPMVSDYLLGRRSGDRSKLVVYVDETGAFSCEFDPDDLRMEEISCAWPPKADKEPAASDKAGLLARIFGKTSKRD